MGHGVVIVKAIAIIEVERAGPCFRILSCPANSDFIGISFMASRDKVSPQRIGDYVVVRFCPDDQFAHECPEALT